MRGFLNIRESEFLTFCEKIQNAAKDQGCVFLAYAADTNPERFGDYICADFSGWLIPEEYADEAERDWAISNDEENMEKWEDYFLFAVWSDVNGQVKIEFKTYDCE